MDQGEYDTTFCVLLILYIGGALEGFCSIAIMYVTLGIFGDIHYKLSTHI